MVKREITFKFYEINPDVLHFCDTYFTYRKDTAAQVDVVLGDARISMEREKSRQQPGNYDVFAVDAFSSDAIPVHLLTRECYLNYWYHLKKDGILALHVSSRYFNLDPVIRSLADLDKERGVQALLIDDPGSAMQETDATRWILITSNQKFLADPQVKAATTPWPIEDCSRPAFHRRLQQSFSVVEVRRREKTGVRIQESEFRSQNSGVRLKPSLRSCEKIGINKR